MFQQKDTKTFTGSGINHDQEAFTGYFRVQPLPGKSSFTTHYRAVRNLDDQPVHEEIGLLTLEPNGDWVFHLHMEELPCTTTHRLKSSTDNRWIFEFTGTEALAGFSSELVFEFSNDNQFRYTHRWAMNEALSDKSWCDLSA
ncbi:hypothetical protein [Reinekea blandensis]|uniref:Uncharacterized protein n=1 Tax=Reinekea blandensis MED297 TaxID=314283 RepID=A4BBR7_9GAMM|nr:hypothetical protein [Reinekea blandensis]EAR10402.1 hypothetical protein MED297_01235 [Reinekea sp. MED297] [Reinekea blandensis MED297]